MKDTYFNLAKAYVGESQARNRYTFYASIARKEGFEQIAEVFQVTADQEKEHASNLFKLIDKLHLADEGSDKIVLDGVEVPNVRGTTVENLAAAIAGETYEFEEMYPAFAEIAANEGYNDIAIRLRAIAKAESHHADNYKKLLELVKEGAFFSRETVQTWVCRECGYLHVGLKAPLICPSCDHSQAFYQVVNSNY